MEIMRCTVRRQLLDVDVPTLVALTYDYINVKATFSSEWAGMQKWLHIRNVEDQSIIAHVVFNNDEIGEDVGLNLSAGEWDVWIHGALYEDNTLIKRITTNVKKIKVEATGTQDEILPSIGPSVAEQAVAAAERAEAAADEAEDSAESASGYADSAQGYANDAQTYATTAQQYMINANIDANEARNAAFNAEHYATLAATAVTHYPKIVDNYWYVWDVTNETWTNTNVLAEGATFTPSVDSYGNLSWTNNAGLPNPPSVNLVSLFDNVPELQARMDEILAEAEEGIADIEEQRDTILASIAAAAELGTDTTLTVSGMAADAKATGDAIANVGTAWPASCVSDFTRINFSTVIYNKIDDNNLRMYGTSNVAYVRYVNVFNGATNLLTAVTQTPKTFPAGKYKFHYTFSGTLATRMTVIKNTTNADTIPFEDGDVVDVPVPFGVGFRVPANANWGTEDAPSYLYFKAECLSLKDPSILFPTGDQTDRTADIYAALSAFGKCTLSKGDYYISALTLPAKSLLCGCGRDSTLMYKSDAESTGITMKFGSTIENLKIVGPKGEGWTPDGVAADRHGIVVNTEGDTDINRNRLTINNVEITGFDGAGIYTASTGYNNENSGNISNCYIHGNNYGLDIPTRSEYNRVCNCSFAHNHVGVRNNGGNNLFSNCGINGNNIGLVMDATEVADATNNSHGTFSGCTFNHSTDWNNTTLTAIQMNGMTSGEVFSGCHIAYGAISIVDSRGIHFADCNFLSSTPITVTGTYMTLFSDCVFYSTQESPITGGGNVILTNCYNRSGTPIT